MAQTRPFSTGGSMRGITITALVLAMSGVAGDVSGKWSGAMTPVGEDGQHPIYMILSQDGDKLSGSGGPNESDQHPFQNGKVSGDRLTFDVPSGKGTFSFDLKISGDEIKGDL